MYLESGELFEELLGSGFAWLDTKSNESLLDTAMFVQTIENRQGFQVTCLEGIALNNDWITRNQIKRNTEILPKDSYFRYLMSLV